MAPSDLEKVCDGLAHAFRARECRVTLAKPGRAWLEVHHRDVLQSVVPPIDRQAPADLNGVPIGACEDGDIWRLRLSGTHVLIAGATGSGKGSVLWSLLQGLGSDIRNGRVQVWAMDPKGGMELCPGQLTPWRAHPSATRGLRPLRTLLPRRSPRIGGTGLGRGTVPSRPWDPWPTLGRGRYGCQNQDLEAETKARTPFQSQWRQL